MNDPKGTHRMDAEIDRDFAALDAATSAGLPSARRTVQRARNRADDRARSTPMAIFRYLRMHPALTTAIVVVVAGAAFAADRIIRISTDGKSAAQIESEIQGALASEGFGDAEVSVTDAGEGRREIKIGIEREGDGSDADAPMPKIVLTKDGQDLDGMSGDMAEVKVKKMMTDSGTATLVVDVAKDGSAASVEIPDADSMDDYALERAIQTELDRAGLNLRVTVSGGRIDIE